MTPKKYAVSIGRAMLGLAVALGPMKVSASEQRVQIKDFLYAPASLKVRAGTTITWINRDDEPHTVVSNTGLFRSGAMDTNETYSFKFDKPGTYLVVCSIHPRMVATIVVH